MGQLLKGLHEIFISSFQCWHSGLRHQLSNTSFCLLTKRGLRCLRLCLSRDLWCCCRRIGQGSNGRAFRQTFDLRRISSRLGRCSLSFGLQRTNSCAFRKSLYLILVCHFCFLSYSFGNATNLLFTTCPVTLPSLSRTSALAPLGTRSGSEIIGFPPSFIKSPTLRLFSFRAAIVASGEFLNLLRSSFSVPSIA